MTERKPLPDDIADAEKQLRPLYQAAAHKAPPGLRERVLAAAREAESDEATESEGPPLKAVNRAARPGAFSNWRVLAMAAVLVLTVAGVFRKLERFSDVHRLPASEIARADVPALPDKAGRHTFYELLPGAGVSVESQAAQPASCQVIVSIDLRPIDTDRKAVMEIIEKRTPAMITVSVRDPSTGSAGTFKALPSGLLSYTGRVAVEAENCAQKKMLVFEPELSELGLVAMPEEASISLERSSDSSVKVLVKKAQ